jgi:phage shock protein PspC (stress-responsive transcriptional regulator)
MNAEENQPQPKRLLRSRSERVIGGVCGGLGRYFNVDPIIVRIAAVALALLGGAGLLLYLAALLLVPSDDSPAAASPLDGRNRGLAVAGVVVLLLVAWPFLLGGGLLVAGILIPLAFLVTTGVLVWWLVSGEGPSGDAGDIARRAALGIGVLIACLVIAVGGAWAAAAGGDTIVAILVIGAGALVLAGAFLTPVRWLILPAVALGLAAGTVSASGLDLDGGVGEREYRPASTTDLHDRYQLGMGELVIDLRDTELPAGDVPVEVDLGIGEARVLVPYDVCVATDAEIGMGGVRVLGRHNGGIDVDYEEAPDAGSEVTRLVLDAEVGIGELRVSDGTDFDDFDRDRFGFGPPDPPRFEDERRGNLACVGGGETTSG